jgi:hypothetical protein
MKTIIKCPKCNWEHDWKEHWMCTCGHFWDTFTTRGRCPSCGYQWKHTACPSCSKWSRHLDWYHEPIDDHFSETDQTESVPELEKLLVADVSLKILQFMNASTLLFTYIVLLITFKCRIRAREETPRS